MRGVGGVLARPPLVWSTLRRARSGIVLDDVQLDFKDSFSSRNRVRNAEQIESLVKSVRLVREQAIQNYETTTTHTTTAPTITTPTPTTATSTPLYDDNDQSSTPPQPHTTNNDKKQFISLVLDETAVPKHTTGRTSRYMVLQEIKTNTEININQTQRYSSSSNYY